MADDPLPNLIGTDDRTDDGIYDAVIIGAGVSGLYQLHRFLQLGFSTLAIEAGTDVGGTWYWNRYPGARFDSESYSYGYSWSDDLLEDWDWQERFSAQPENLSYLRHVADRFDLRRHIRFGTFVTGARYDADTNRWQVTARPATGDGVSGDNKTSDDKGNGDDGYLDEIEARYLVTALGPLSVPVYPAVHGRDRFAGRSWHTSHWPRNDDGSTDTDPVAGKRVAVIGTGATAVQLIPEVAKVAGHLTIFQRTPNWCAPLHNGPIQPEEMAEIKTRYREIFDTCDGTFAGFLHVPDRRKALECSAEEREELWERLWGEPGFGIWMANFRDVLVNTEANRLLSDWVAGKIRERLDDPAIAERLIPTNHGFGTRRVPMETNYYEVYNQPNVELVSLGETPIIEITESGIRTAVEVAAAEGAGGPDDGYGDAEHRDHEFDVIIYATGFDAVLGGFNRLDIRGVDGVALADVWADGPRTYLGIQISGFPNLFTLVGPNNASTFCNMPRCIEQNVDWVTEFIEFCEREGVTRAEPTEEAMEAWGEHVVTSGERMLFTKVNSWFTGINSNLVGRDQRQFLLYAAGLPTYREWADEVAANGYEGFVFS
ncbi:MAG: NAD(P)/FAD-dependent oxidoreductase [Actinomycetota bacterium]